MEKIRLTKITHYEKDRDNKPLLTKNNKPYVRCLIVDDKGRRISGFGSVITQMWKEGDEVNVEITQNGNYLNFKLPDQRVSRAEFDELKKRVTRVEDEIEMMKNEGKPESIEEVDFGNEPEGLGDEPEGVGIGSQ